MDKSILFYCLSSLIFIGLIASLFVSLTGNDFTFSFSYFLEVIANTPDIVSNFSFPDLSISSDWGIFNFLRTSLNAITSSFSFLVFLVVNLAQVAIYLFYLIKSFFIFI